MQKTIPHRDCSEKGVISKYVSNVAFLYQIYREKHYFSHKVFKIVICILHIAYLIEIIIIGFFL